MKPGRRIAAGLLAAALSMGALGLAAPPATAGDTTWPVIKDATGPAVKDTTWPRN